MNGNSTHERLMANVRADNAAEYARQMDWDIAARPLQDAYEAASEAGDREAARALRAEIKALGPRPVPGVTNV